MPSSSLFNIVQLLQLVFISLTLLNQVQVASVQVSGGICDYGRDQSPINIDTSDVNLIPRAQPIVFVNYNVTTLELNSSPSTVTASPSSNYQLEAGIAAGGLRGFFKLLNIHFHWNSEHTFNKKRYPLELHFVHYNSVYGNFQEANKYHGGVAVVAVLFTEGPKSKPVQEIIDKVDELIKVGVSKIELDLKPADFLPKDYRRFYRYHGSLTAQPCSESVYWSIFEERNVISKEQVRWFQNSSALNILKLPSANNRDIQKDEGRKVELWIGSYKNKALSNCRTNNYLVLLLLLFFYVKN